MNTQFYKNRFLNKVMIITGSATGIGRATALRAGLEGAKLVLVDLKKEEGLKTLEDVLATGADAIFLELDLSNKANVEYMISQTIDKYGKLDIAINNAGVMGNPSMLHKLDEKDFDYTMQNNIYSVSYCCKEELKVFMKQGSGGVIVNNASIAGITGLPGNPAYVASKHAVNGLTKNLAIDYAKYNIRVNSVNPAGTDTPMVEEAFALVKAKMQEAINNGVKPEDAGSMAGLKTETLQRRNATAQEQANSILFLASDDASHMTGAILQTDGGWTSY